MLAVCGNGCEFIKLWLFSHLCSHFAEMLYRTHKHSHWWVHTGVFYSDTGCWETKQPLKSQTGLLSRNIKYVIQANVHVCMPTHARTHAVSRSYSPVNPPSAPLLLLSECLINAQRSEMAWWIFHTVSRPLNALSCEKCKTSKYKRLPEQQRSSGGTST